MAKRNFKIDIDLNQNELLKARIENLSSAPSTPKLGQIYYDTSKSQLGLCINATGPVWSYGGDITNVIGGSGGITVSVDGAGVATISLSAATTSTPGSMSAADKTKLDNATASSTINTLVLRDGSGNIAVNKITINNAPVANTDGVNKAYVDAIAQGLKVKSSVRVISTVNVAALTGLLVVDGVTTVAGNRVLLINQTTSTQDGIYIVAAGAWTRATDFAIGLHVASCFLFVEEGTVNSDTGWVCTNDAGTDVVGTDDLIFSQFSGAGTINAGFGLTKTGNTIDVVAADNSIDVQADSIAVKLNATGGLETTSTGLNVKTDTDLINKNGSNELTIGNGVAKVVYKSISIGTTPGIQTITHNLGTKNINVVVYDTTTFEIYECEVIFATANTITVFASGTTTTVIVAIIGNVGISL